jgi:hypothetical protein
VSHSTHGLKLDWQDRQAVNAYRASFDNQDDSSFAPPVNAPRFRDEPVGRVLQQHDKCQQVELDDSQDKLGGHVDSWVVIPREGIPQGTKDQPSPPQGGGRGRNARAHVSPNSKPSNLHSLVNPTPPRNLPLVPPSSKDSHSSPPRPGQTVPADWDVAWKGEGKEPLPAPPKVHPTPEQRLILLDYDYDSDSDGGGVAIRNRAPGPLDEKFTMAFAQRIPNRDLPLKLQIDSSGQPISDPNTPVSSPSATASPLSANRSSASPPMSAESLNDAPGVRESTFRDSWSFRPPPEDVYKRLEEFFPDHDLDKPVIDKSKGSHLEEVVTTQAKAGSATSLSDSPSGDSKRKSWRCRAWDSI